MNFNELPTYELIQQQELKDLKSEGYYLRHKKSGARILLMKNDDDNKVFSVGFRTPPEDSTGLPHILEHSVLCGSKNFPIKDPFVELVKGSLNTFLNAMTFPDKTVYPVASCNDKDFQNLMHVYMDAVFYPNIHEKNEIFRQEGWSYNLESADHTLTYNGVVYNEMKGAYSSPESVLDRVVLHTLFPDTCYANDSGGDPDVIPNLTYEQFTAFHKKYYHPSNSYIYLYGDMDFVEKLEWLDKAYLSLFDAQDIESEIQFQKPFDAVKEIEETYSITSGEPEEDNTYLSYNKVIGTALDEKLYLAFEVLDYALLSAPGAPLKKALVDAGIGKDIMGAYESCIYQPMFSVVAKNANVEQKEAFVNVIESTLRDIVENGIDQKSLEAGIHYNEFRYREADFGSYPKGLMYNLQIFDSWLYDDEKPFIHLSAIKTYDFLKSQIATGYFENLIQTYILDNKHGAVVVVKPERGRTARMDKELEEKLAAYKASLSEAEVEALVNATKQLVDYQEEEEKPEDMEKIPVLERSDISREIAPIQNEELDMDGTKVVLHEIDTNGIGYVDLIFDLSGVSAEELPYVGILQAVLGIIDTENYEYGELFNEINMHTGGISTSIEVYPDVTRVKEKEFKATFEVKAKALYSKMPIAFAMMQEIMTKSKLDDEKRLKEILAMTISRLQMRFQSAGHQTAAARALSYASPISKFKELTGGIDFYAVVKRIEENFEEEKNTLVSKLEKLVKKLFRADNMMISYTAERVGLEGFAQEIASVKTSLFTDKVEDTPCVIHCEKQNEGFKTSSKVQYVARVGNFVDAGYEYTGAFQILKVILGYEYLWQNVRVKGGAYGCISNFNRLGEAYFSSYRDPNLEKTNAVYEGVVDYLRNFKVSERDMTKYIIGTMSNLDQPMTPVAKGDRSMTLYMNCVNEEMIREERNQILDAKEEDIRALADVVAAALVCNQLCVIGGEDKIEEQKDLFMEIKNLF
ncbi:MAG: insulinase family protein [Faecalimonas sp.]|nr:insulinase family protein [Faecalimonas sp.]